MHIIPAIDIIDGDCVRLFKGDYAEKKVYFRSPVAQARFFEQHGADIIHIVDLDGAKAGHVVNKDTIRNIRKEVSIPLELGGGIRSLETAQEMLELGIDRIILGTAAITNPTLVTDLLKLYGPERIVVGIDARNGKVAVKGWEEKTEIGFIDLAEQMFEKGVRIIIYTDIFRDGTLTHPNFDDLDALVQTLPEARIIASGGVSKMEHIDTLAGMKVDGVILGKCLYEGNVSLDEVTQKY